MFIKFFFCLELENETVVLISPSLVLIALQNLKTPSIFPSEFLVPGRPQNAYFSKSILLKGVIRFLASKRRKERVRSILSL